MTRPTDEQLCMLFDRSPVGMYRSTRDGQLLYWNPALARIVGYASDEMARVNVVRDLYADPGERERLVARFGPRGMTADGAIVQWRHKDGRPLTIRLFGHIAEGEAGESFDAWVMDITDAERQRQDLESTAATLDIVVKQVSAVWWIADRELTFRRAGGPIPEMFGFPANTFIGRTLDDALDSDPATDGVRSLRAHRRALGGETVRFTSEYRSRVLENTIAPYRVGDEILGAIGTAVDVTATRALERRMVDAQRAESLGVLAGGLAHDFNNLLVAILGNADLALRDIPPGSPGRAALENIRYASLRAAELTDQLLAYAGRGNISSERIHPRPLVEELIRISAPQTASNIAIDVDIPDSVGLRGDAAQIRQIVMNLIVNARDALGDRGGRIAISARQVVLDGNGEPDDVVTPSAGVYVQLEIADDGPGMDGDTRRRIFDPFFTTKATGHGLGLAAVLGIVRAHGGGLRLRTAPGRGTTFQVILPATSTPIGQPVATPPAHTVLVVDDEDLVRDVVVRMLQDMGYAALAAPDGYAALDLIARTPPDVALVDLTMPRMSGADLVAQLRARHPGVKIVLCTGYDRDRKGPVAADAYLPKPFRMEALETTLRRLVAG